MEDKDSLIARLKEEIRARDHDIHRAATFGKQLFEEKIQLSSKIDDLISEKELLVQEKHSLQLDLETQIDAVKSQTNELELQRDLADSLNAKLQISEKENETLCKKMENLAKENQYLKKIQQDLDVENKSLVDRIDLFKKQIKNFEDQAEKSLCEVEKNEIQELQTRLNTYMLNNKDLVDALSASQCELEIAKKNENHLLEMVHELEETIKEKSSEISACHAEINKAKEEIEELQVEVETFKYDQVDVNRRGNSVFAELDDRRNMVEREYKILRKRYEQFQKDYEENKKELDMCRGQVAILQSKVSRAYQEAYIDKLEDNLLTSRRELSDLAHKFSKAVKSNSDVHAERSYSEKNQYDYLRVMLKQLQQKERELQNEVANLTFKNIYDNDKLIETQHLLYKSKEELDSAKQEIFKLKQQVNELELGIIHKLPNELQTLKPKIEVLDGFEPSAKTTENKMLNKLKPDPFADLDIIPGELELGEDGFQQIKPPRKSNKFMLQDFNRIKLDDEKTEDFSKFTSKASEVIGEINEEVSVETKENANVANRTNESTKVINETQKYKPRSHSKVAPNKRDGNCAQQ